MSGRVRSGAPGQGAGRRGRRKRPGRAGRRGWLVVVAGLFLAGLIGAVSAGRQALSQPARPGATVAITVVVPAGSGLFAIADALRDAGVIRRAWALEALALRDGSYRRLQAGTYSLSPGLTPRQVLAALAGGHVAPVPTVRLTIPEGWNVHQVLGAITAAGLGTPDELTKAASDPGLLARAALPAPAPGSISPLDGYLYPSTYTFPADATAQTVLARLLAEFNAIWTPALASAARANAGLDLAQAVTLASIVQREVSRPADMAVVAGIYLHRLELGMPLDADPTVLYGLGLVAQNAPLDAHQLASPSAYNTYRVHGLPPGPICNPGLDALTAVAHPTKTAALYFLTAPDGTLVTADTLAEQEANTRKYLGY